MGKSRVFDILTYKERAGVGEGNSYSMFFSSQGLARRGPFRWIQGEIKEQHTPPAHRVEVMLRT